MNKTYIQLLKEIFIAGVLAGAALACSLAPTVSPAPGKVGETAPVVQPGGVATPQPDSGKPAGSQRGPGSFDLSDARVGLNSLPAYHTSLTTSFKGSRQGQIYLYNTTLTHDLSRQPAAELTVLESNEQPDQLVYLLYGQFSGARYVKSGKDQPCLGEGLTAASEGDTGALPDPAASLPAVYGAEKTGNETINGVAAVHYRFDERALVRYRGVRASGDLWVAEQGGWVVRYTLTVQGPENTLGPKLAGEQSWQYEAIELKDDILLPPGCQSVLVDFPVAPIATGQVSYPGYLAYTSSMPVAGVAAFYQEQLTGQGWQQAIQDAGDPQAPLLFKKVDTAVEKFAAITLKPATGGTSVEVMVVEINPATSALPTHAPAATKAAPTLDPKEAGLPASVPLYPNGYDFTARPGGMLFFMTDDPPDMVASFYRQQLAANGWTLLNELQDRNQAWKNDTHILSLTFNARGKGTEVIIALMKSP